ncbi:MAG: hypothetical protein ABSB70_14450 [Candidatus Velthaea sp.]|jgi:hypothetical protein
MRRIVLCLAAIAAMLARPECAPASSPAIDSSARTALRASGVPVLLPSPLPRAIGTIRSVAVVNAGRGGYYVGYSPLAHCAGALACAFFHVAGFAAPARLEPLAHDRPVLLFDGTHAVFRAKDCSGSSCTEASLLFERRGSLYEIDAKVPAGDLTVLVSAYRTLHVVR